MKKIIVWMLLLCLAMSLVACGGGETDITEPSTEATEASTGLTESKDDAYTVTVVDESGNPVAGAWLMLCKLGDGGSCTPADSATDENGKVSFKLPKDSYKASFDGALPDGYAMLGDTNEFYFAGDSMELTVVVSKLPPVDEN